MSGRCRDLSHDLEVLRTAADQLRARERPLGEEKEALLAAPLSDSPRSVGKWWRDRFREARRLFQPWRLEFRYPEILSAYQRQTLRRSRHRWARRARRRAYWQDFVIVVKYIVAVILDVLAFVLRVVLEVLWLPFRLAHWLRSLF